MVSSVGAFGHSVFLLISAWSTLKIFTSKPATEKPQEPQVWQAGVLVVEQPWLSSGTKEIKRLSRIYVSIHVRFTHQLHSNCTEIDSRNGHAIQLVNIQSQRSKVLQGIHANRCSSSQCSAWLVRTHPGINDEKVSRFFFVALISSYFIFIS